MRRIRGLPEVSTLVMQVRVLSPAPPIFLRVRSIRVIILRCQREEAGSSPAGRAKSRTYRAPP